MVTLSYRCALMRERLLNSSAQNKSAQLISLTFSFNLHLQKTSLKGKDKVIFTYVYVLKGNFWPSVLSRYIELKDKANLDAVPGVVFCPRPQCVARIFSDVDSNLVQCDSCGFPFCKLCNQTWHGPGPCPTIEKVQIAISVSHMKLMLSSYVM